MKKFSIEELANLSINFREHILLSDVVEKTDNGFWIQSLYDERIFVTRHEISLMLQFVSKCI